MAANKPRHIHAMRAVVEIGFIIFLFYSNLLMGEFNRSSHKTLAVAIHDCVTPVNFIIGLSAGLIGYAVVEFLRHKL